MVSAQCSTADVHPLDAQDVDPPYRKLVQTYLGLDPPTEFSIEDLAERTQSNDRARKFASEATDHYLAVRVKRGRYVALNPSIAVRCWGVPSYYAELLALHDCLAHLEVEHAFACLTATRETDLVFDRPWIVTPPDVDRSLSEIDRFRHEIEETESAELETFGDSFTVPILQPEQTALILAATSLPRERDAARDILAGLDLDTPRIREFNALGLELDPDILESREPKIQLPTFVEEKRRQLADDLLREGER